MSTSNTDQEDLKKQWDDLEVNIVPNTDPYPVKRANLAKVIREIDLSIRKGEWRHWKSWSHWDHEHTPITFCFTCKYAIKPTKTVSPQGALKKLHCPVCDLVLFDSRYD